jgi:thioredoxin reductase
LLLDDGRTALIDALFLAPRSQLNSPIAERLGCALDDGPFGKVIRTDGAKLTTVPSGYAAGDIARVPQNAS